jgi:hypothetical protein
MIEVAGVNAGFPNLPQEVSKIARTKGPGDLFSLLPAKLNYSFCGL